MQFEPYCEVVSTRWGKMLANPHDAYVGRSLIDYGEFSPGESRLFQWLLPSHGRVIEVGSNIGALTVPLAKLVGPRGVVIAIEPQRACFQMLCGSLALNGITNVRALWAAAGSSSAQPLRVPFLDPARPNNFGGLEIQSADLGAESVPVVTVDEVLATLELQSKAFALLKVDVEGMEGDVLAGAERLLTSVNRPALYVENDREAKSPALIQQLQSWGYKLWWHRPPLYEAENFRKNPRNQFERNGLPIVSLNLLGLWDGHPLIRAVPKDLEPL